MDIILYFTLGAINIVLLYLFTSIYKHKTGIDLFPGRENGDILESVSSLCAYFASGPIGTIIVIILGLFLFILWFKYYRKK